MNDVIETNARRLINNLPFSASTMTRSLNELVERGLLNIDGSNTRKIYKTIGKSDFWEKGKQFLFNPVSKTYYTKPNVDFGKMLISNETALSKLSKSLNESRIVYYAAESEEIKSIRKYFVSQYNIFDDNYCIIEQFKYNPHILSNSDCIDVISLYAQLKDCKDERVQMALDEIIGEKIC